MFFKKKREAQKAVAEQARQDVLNRIQAQIDAVRDIKEPADQYLRLEEIRHGVDGVIAQINGAIPQEARKTWKSTYWKTSGPAAAGGVALIFLVGPVFAVPAFGGIIAGGILADRSVRKKAEQLQAEAEPFFEALKAKQEAATALADDILGRNVQSIAASSDFEGFLAKAPRAKDAFTRAFAKQAKPVQAPKPDNDGPRFKL